MSLKTIDKLILLVNLTEVSSTSVDIENIAIIKTCALSQLPVVEITCYYFTIPT